MEAHELQASGKARNHISDALRPRPLIQKILFVSGDQFNVLLD